MRSTVVRLVVAAAVLVLAVPAFAQKGGNGNGPSSQSVRPCLVAGNEVTGTGLPTGEVINFMVTDAYGTRGWVLGFTSSGTWTVTVPDRYGPTTYEFVSKTWGPSGSKYTVFAACTAS